MYHDFWVKFIICICIRITSHLSSMSMFVSKNKINKTKKDPSTDSTFNNQLVMTYYDNSYSIEFFSLFNLSPPKQTTRTSPSIGHVWFNMNFYDNLFLLLRIENIYDILVKTSSIRLLYLLFYSAPIYSHNPIYLRYRGYWKSKCWNQHFYFASEYLETKLLFI